MPGIVGLQTRMPRGWAEPQLKRMVEALQHEHFYVTGIWTDETIGVYIGWVARNNSFLGCMPLTDDLRDLKLIFSGEEFAIHAVKQPMDTHQQHGAGALPYLLQLAQSDPGFPSCLNGRFHGALADRRGGTITLFNDRYGMHRLYYHESPEAFYFAAEAKAILAVRPEVRRIEPRAMGEFVTCGCVLENRTLFEGIHILPGAAKWVIRNGVVEQKGAYFQPREWEQQDILEEEKYYQELRDIFSQNLPRYFESQERIGLSLTGGLDTRMILAWQKPVPRSVPCYTFCGPHRVCQDVVVARQVAHACGLAHEVIKLGEDFLARFPYYAERTVYLTDGCADVRRSSDLYLNERVREIAPIRMTGNYGSEVLRGIRAFKPIKLLPSLFREEVVPYFYQAEETYRSLIQGHPISFAVFKQAPWHHYGLLALEETQVTIRSPYLDNDLVRTVFRGPQSTFANHDICLRLIAEGSLLLRAIPTDRGVGGVGLRGAVSRRTLEFLTKVEYAYDYGMPQWLAQIDKVLSPLHLERLFLGTQKFNHYRVWYRDALAGYIREMLLDQRSLSRPHIQRTKLEAMVEGHCRGWANYTNEIHILLTLELIHRLFIESN